VPETTQSKIASNEKVLQSPLELGVGVGQTLANKLESKSGQLL